MRKIATVTVFLFILCTIVNAQKKRTSKKPKKTTVQSIKKIQEQLKGHDTSIVKIHNQLKDITNSLGKTDSAISSIDTALKNSALAQTGAGLTESKKQNDSCKCGGLSFDTCCPVKKICCETKLDATETNKYILQKNFADATVFAYKYFKLNGKKDNLCIRVCNINRIAYDITAEGTVIKSSLPDSSIFDGLNTALNGAGSLQKDKTTPAATPVAKTDEEDTIKVTVVLSPFQELEESIKTPKNEIKNKFNQLQEHLKRLEHFASFAKNVPVIIGSECCSQQNIKNRIGNQAEIKAFDPTVNYANLSDKINADLIPLYDNAKKEEKGIQDGKKEIEEMISNYKEAHCKKKDTLINGVKYTKLSAECDKLDGLKKLSNDADVSKALEIAGKLDKDDLVKSLNAVNDLLAKVNNDANFFYTNCFDKNDAEFIDISFKAIPKDEYKTKLDSQVYKYKVPVTGRFKWAIGPSLNFHIGSALTNQSFSLDSIVRRYSNFRGGDSSVTRTDSFNVSQNPSRSKLNPYIGFMAHFYWQDHNKLTPGIAIGLSTSLSQITDLRAYLGGSLIIGGALKGKVILSAGAAFAWVDRLKPNLAEGPNYKNRLLFNGNNLPSADQLVDKACKVGFFFGFSYNLRD